MNEEEIQKKQNEQEIIEIYNHYRDLIFRFCDINYSPNKEITKECYIFVSEFCFLVIKQIMISHPETIPILKTLFFHLQMRVLEDEKEKQQKQSEKTASGSSLDQLQ